MIARDWLPLLSEEIPAPDIASFRLHANTGRPLGSAAFLRELEIRTGRPLAPQKRGPKLKSCKDDK